MCNGEKEDYLLAKTYIEQLKMPICTYVLFIVSSIVICAFYPLKEAARVLLFGKRVGVPSAGRNY